LLANCSRIAARTELCGPATWVQRSALGVAVVRVAAAKGDKSVFASFSAMRFCLCRAFWPCGFYPPCVFIPTVHTTVRPPCVFIPTVHPTVRPPCVFISTVRSTVQRNVRFVPCVL
jgi:hypothetical protein